MIRGEARSATTQRASKRMEASLTTGSAERALHNHAAMDHPNDGAPRWWRSPSRIESSAFSCWALSLHRTCGGVRLACQRIRQMTRGVSEQRAEHQ